MNTGGTDCAGKVAVAAYQQSQAALARDCGYGAGNHLAVGRVIVAQNYTTIVWHPGNHR